MEEIWKDVPGFEGLYQASTLGRVKSLDRMVNTGAKNITKCKKTGKILKNKIDNRGRAHITLSKEGKRFFFQTGNIIAITFIPNPENKPKIMHIDGNKLNNTLENIKWATNKEIVEHTWTRFDRNIVIFEGKKFNTQAAAARYYGIDPALFCSRKQKGWSTEENLKIKPGILKNRGKAYLYKYKDKSYTLQQLAEENRLTKDALVKRLQNGWGLYEAVETPLVIRNRKKEV